MSTKTSCGQPVVTGNKRTRFWGCKAAALLRTRHPAARGARGSPQIRAALPCTLFVTGGRTAALQTRPGGTRPAQGLHLGKAKTWDPRRDSCPGCSPHEQAVHLPPKPEKADRGVPRCHSHGGVSFLESPGTQQPLTALQGPNPSFRNHTPSFR